jgi:hypothetical protein
VQLPPLFLDLMVQAVACHLLQQDAGTDFDMWQWRTAEMLFRRQRVSVQDGRVLAGDSEVLDMSHETGGLGAIGRLLKENSTALPVVNLQVLNDANAERYQQSLAGAGRFNFLLDLTHEVQRELPHGLTLTMTRAQSGLKALAQRAGEVGAALSGHRRCRYSPNRGWTMRPGAGTWGWIPKPPSC